MKTMSCRQLGGPDSCEEVFQAETFEEMAVLSREHGMKMFEKQDEAHMAAGKKMQMLMEAPGSMEKWYEEKKKEFEALPS